MDKLGQIDKAIRRYYHSQKPVSKDLIEAILYSVDSGGKRIRPLILLELLEGFGCELTPAYYDVAASLEMIHTGSLIHDDLPAMDNDDYRRGRLANHKKFDEATAILAADSLFLDASGLIAEADLDADVKIELIQLLSRSSGTFGMVGGQMLDMQGEGKQLAIDGLKKIHANKTGALLAFPFVAAGIIAKCSEDIKASLAEVGQLIGFSFQVRDDILDVTADFEVLGKTQNKDLDSEKSTYPALVGLEMSQVILEESLNQATAIFRKLSDTHDFQSDKIMSIIERLRLNA